MGLLKLNSPGSGVTNSMPHCLHANFSLKTQRRGRWVLRSGFFEDHFAAFAVTDFGGIDDALMQVGSDDEAIHQYKNAAA